MPMGLFPIITSVVEYICEEESQQALFYYNQEKEASCLDLNED